MLYGFILMVTKMPTLYERLILCRIKLFYYNHTQMKLALQIFMNGQIVVGPKTVFGANYIIAATGILFQFIAMKTQLLSI